MNESGQTLIEVLVALAAAVVIIAAIVSASLNALTNSDFTRNQNLATQYTQEGLEIIRDMRNASIASISATYLADGTYCLAKSCTALDQSIPSCWSLLSSSCGQNVDIFVRQVTIDHESAYCNSTPTPTGQPGFLTSTVGVTVTTSWYDSKCAQSSNQFCHSVSLSSCFSDFTVLPSP